MDDGGSGAKRPREEEGGAAQVATKKPAISMDALEKAKKALQLQKELKEKMKNMPQVSRSQASTDGLVLHACSVRANLA